MLGGNKYLRETPRVPGGPWVVALGVGGSVGGSVGDWTDGLTGVV